MTVGTKRGLTKRKPYPTPTAEKEATAEEAFWGELMDLVNEYRALTPNVMRAMLKRMADTLDDLDELKHEGAEARRD